VNNQFQDRPFTQYETEFPALLKKAVLLTGNDSGRVVVVSIPDYAYTPFEQNLDSDKISEEIDRYNEFAPETASGSGVKYVNITDITRLGLERPELVTRDGLHPSEKAYKLFTDRIFPAVFNKLRN
jgi:lysophospholipase L1-like esterase